MNQVVTVLTNGLVAFLLAALMKCGGGILRSGLLRRDEPGEVVFDIPLGGLALFPVMFAAQMLGGYRPAFGYVLLALGAVSLLDPALRRDVKRGATWLGERTFPERCLLAVIGLFVVAAGLLALAPPHAKDALIYHLTVQKLYLANQGFREFPGFVQSYFPQGMESLFAMALMVRCDRAPAVIHFCFGLSALAGGYRLARRLGASRPFALLPVLALTVTPIFWFEMTAPYVDLGVMAFTVLAFLALVQWPETGNRSFAVLAGLFLGGALSVKYLALISWILVAGMVVAFLFYRKHDLSLVELVRGLAMVFIPALAVASPYLLRNLWLTRNPFYPFLFELFPTVATNWDQDRTQVLLQFIRISDFPLQTLSDWIALPFRICLLGEHENLRRFEGEIGPLYLLFPVSFLLWKTWSFQLRVTAVFFGLFFLYWLFNSPLVRFLLPVLPLALAVTARSAEMLWTDILNGPQRRPGRFAAAFLGVVLAAFGGYRTVHFGVTDGAWRVLTGVTAPSDFLRGRFEEISFFEWLNWETPPDTRVWLVDTGARTYYLDRPFVSDFVLEHHTLSVMVIESRDVDDLARKVAGLKAQYLLVAPTFLFDERSTPFDTDAQKERLRQFLRTRCRMVKAGDRLILFRLPE